MAKTIAAGVITSDGMLRSMLLEIQSALVDVVLNSAGLAIGSSSKPKVKIVNTTYAMVNGIIVKKTTAEITLPASTVTNAYFNVFVLTIASDGTVTATAGTQATTLAGVVFPQCPADNATIGFVIVNPTGTGNFVAGTNDLDDGTIVPNAVYINTPFPVGQNMLAL